MIEESAGAILDIFTFNKSRGVNIQALPEVFYNTSTHGNSQGTGEAVVFDIPFGVIRDYGLQILEESAAGAFSLPSSAGVLG